MTNFSDPPGPNTFQLLRMPLESFEREGRPIRMRSKLGNVYFVPGLRDAEALNRRRVSRGRIWTARELRDLLSDGKPSILAAAILASGFGGTIEELG